MSQLCVDKLCVSKLCVSKLCVSKLCVDKLCVSKWCVDKLCVSKSCVLAGGGRRECRTKNKEPHTKMWGIVLMVTPSSHSSQVARS